MSDKKVEKSREDESDDEDDETKPRLMAVSVYPSVLRGESDIKAKLDNVPSEMLETKPRLMSVSVNPSSYRGELDIRAKLDNFPSGVLKKGEKKSRSDVHEKNYTTWEIGNIPAESSDYRRQRTVIKVTGRIVDEIAGDIFGSNKARSIHAIYNNDNATVKCKTSSYMKFSIRLLKAAKENDTILVDVRRISGCALAFRDEYQALVQVIQPRNRSPPKMHGSVMNTFAGLDLMNLPDIPLGEDIIKDSLESSRKNLKSEMYDTRIITLQDLNLTTDVESKEIASAACKLILGEYIDILQYVIEDISKRIEIINFIDDDSAEYQRGLCLKILGNLLSSENNSQAIEVMIKSNRTSTLITDLVWYVTQHVQSPWNACLAAKCLRLLASNDSTLHTNDKVIFALEDAICYGNAKYDLLEKEATAAQSVFMTKV